MAEVELIIKANTDQYVKGINDAQKATEKLYTTVEKDDIRQKGLIEQQIDRIERLKKALKESHDPKDMAIYNKSIVDATQKIKNYESIGVEANKNIKKSTDELSNAFGGFLKKIGPVALALGVITKITKGVVEAFKDTVFGLNAITVAGEVWKQMSYNVATFNGNIIAMTTSLGNAVFVGKLVNEQRKEERKDLVIASQLREDYNKLYFESADRTKSLEYQLGKLTEAEEVHNKMIDVELENANRQLYIVEIQLQSRKNSNKLLDQEAKLLAQINSIEGQRYSETKRVEMRRSGLKKEILEKDKKAYFDWIDEMNKKQDDYYNLSLKLIDDYDKSQIESLAGKEKLVAQREFGIKQIDELKNQLSALGQLSDKQTKMLQTLADNVWKEYYKALAEEETKPTPSQQKAISEALLGDMEELPGLVRKNVAEVQKEIDATIGANKAMEEFSVWKLIGIDAESDEGKEQIEAVKEFADKTIDIIEDNLDRRVEIAQRERELLDTRISETQNALELETQLMEEGFANNVTAKKKELEDLKKQREKALIEEEEALKRQQAFERISQAVSIATSVANILKEFTKLGPVGLILAAAAVASLFAIWSASKSKAIASTRLAEGGYGDETGVITGRSHHAGGEHFLDHVEVERGETFGVLSRRATDKYGDMFQNIVSSFNKDEMPQFTAPTVSNSINVENSGPNSRLDKVINEQKKLNESILKQTQHYNVGNKRVIKSGNKIRIIG